MYIIKIRYIYILTALANIPGRYDNLTIHYDVNRHYSSTYNNLSSSGLILVTEDDRVDLRNVLAV